MSDPTRKIECDGCGEPWELEFFCKACSGPEVVEYRMPSPFYDGYGDDCEDREITVLRSICLNCCVCRLAAAAPQPVTEEELPF